MYLHLNGTALLLYHSIHYTLIIKNMYSYTKNIKSFSRVETGDFPFIIKDLRQKLSAWFDNSHAKKGLPPPHPSKIFWDSHCPLYTVKRTN